MEDNDATSLVLRNVNGKQKQKQDQDTLSAEDLAWADSCLIEDPELSETNMDSLKEALIDILGILGPSANKRDDSNDVITPENFPAVRLEEGTSDTSMDEHPEDEIPDMLYSLKQPFLPHYNDEMMNFQYSDSDDDDSDAGFAFSDFVMDDPPSGDIFKVWDLDIPVEEDGIVKELKEALSSNNAATGMKGLKVESLDSLVESIADLSLK